MTGVQTCALPISLTAAASTQTVPFKRHVLPASMSRAVGSYYQSSCCIITGPPRHAEDARCRCKEEANSQAMKVHTKAGNVPLFRSSPGHGAASMGEPKERTRREGFKGGLLVKDQKLISTHDNIRINRQRSRSKGQRELVLLAMFCKRIGCVWL